MVSNTRSTMCVRGFWRQILVYTLLVWHLSGSHAIHNILLHSFLNLQEPDRQPKIGPPTTGSTIPGTFPRITIILCSHSGTPVENVSHFWRENEKPCVPKRSKKISQFRVSEKKRVQVGSPSNKTSIAFRFSPNVRNPANIISRQTFFKFSFLWSEICTPEF